MTTGLRVAWTVGMDILMAVMFLVVWLQPYALGEYAVRSFAVCIFVEFMVIHAAAWWSSISEHSASPKKRLSAFILSGVIYTFAMGILSAAAGHIGILVFFWAMMFSHFPKVVLRPPGEEDIRFLGRNWLVMVALWISCMFLTLLPFIPIPAFGITPEVIAAQRPPDDTERGILADEPYRCIAFGVFYYTGLAIWSLISELTARKAAGEGENAIAGDP